MTSRRPPQPARAAARLRHPPPAAEGPAAPAANVLRREVYGFLPYWESVAGPTLNYDLLSTVAYFGVGVYGHRRPPEERVRLGRLDQLVDDERHQQRPCPRHARRAHDRGVRLDHFGVQRAGLAPLERDQPRQRRRPDRRGRQPARRGWREPGLRADRVESGRRLSDLRPDPPGRPGRHPPGLRAGLLRHRIHGLLRRRRPDGGRGGRRRVHHGLRLPDRQLELRRLDRPADQPQAGLRPHPGRRTSGRHVRRSRR